MTYYTRYFVVNLVIECSPNIDWFTHFVFQKNKQIIRLGYIIIEEKVDALDDGRYCYYRYTGFCFEGIHIKKSLSAKVVRRLILTDKSHNFSRCVLKSLTDEEILSMIEDDISNLMPISTKLKLYSYNYDKERINFE